MAQDNIIKIQFKSDGDKGLVRAIEKLDAVHKKLTNTQENLIDVGKKGGRANVNAINTLRRYNERLKKNNLTLKDLNISSFTYSTAVRGNQLALEKVRLATEKHTQSLKRQRRGMFETEHSTRILGGSFAVLRSKLLLASFAGTLVASTLGRLGRQFGVQEDAERNLSTQLGHTNEELLKQASAIQNVTTHGDETLLMIMRFASTLGIQERDLVKVTKASIGLSEAYGLDLRQSTRMLALATSGNTEMLNRYITELRNTTDESEKLAIISQKVTDGYRLHISRAGTLNFTLDQMNNSVGDVAEKIGQVLSPAIIFTAERMKEFADSMDEGKVKRFQLILGLVTGGFIAYRTAVIASAIATNGFSKSLTRTGLGAIAVLAGLFVEQLLSMAGVYEDVEESIDGFNEKQEIANKLTKEQLDNIDKVKKAMESRKKTIDDEIFSLIIRQQELSGANDLSLLELKHGFEFVEMNKKRINILISLRKEVEELEEVERKKLQREKESLSAQEKANKAIEDGLTRLSERQKAMFDFDLAMKRLMNSTIDFPVEKVKQMDDAFKETNTSLDFLTDGQHFALKGVGAFGDAMAQATLNSQKFGEALVNSLNSIASTLIANLATYALLDIFTAGTFSNTTSFLKFAGFAHTGGYIKDDKTIQRFAKGGVVQGEDNIPIMAQSGEFIMSRNAVESIGIENLAQMNQTGNSGITLNISAPLVDETVVDTIIPAIQKAQRMNLA